mmetsp:Transcript_106858/g.312377  ORF Transcript_106858/g.312377 Transcript_106858/m.312377 type:complete len:247 (-) Transcript_106858:53-793(-)
MLHKARINEVCSAHRPASERQELTQVPLEPREGICHAPVWHQATEACINHHLRVLVSPRKVGQARERGAAVPRSSAEMQDKGLPVVRDEVRELLMVPEQRARELRQPPVPHSRRRGEQQLPRVEPEAEGARLRRGEPDKALQAVHLKVAQPLVRRVDRGKVQAAWPVQHEHAHADVAALQHRCSERGIIHVPPPRVHALREERCLGVQVVGVVREEARADVAGCAGCRVGWASPEARQGGCAAGAQ